MAAHGLREIFHGLFWGFCRKFLVIVGALAGGLQGVWGFSKALISDLGLCPKP